MVISENLLMLPRVFLLVVVLLTQSISIKAVGNTRIIIQTFPIPRDVQGSISVLILTNVTLTCNIDPVPETYHYYEWTTTAINGFYSSRYMNHSRIELPWFRSKDSGVYKCAVYNENGGELSNDSVTVTPTGNALATTFPYFRKITNGSTLEVKGHFKIYCLFSEGVMNEASGWYNSSVLQVPEVPSVDYLMKSKKDIAAREFVLMTNQYVFSFANNGTYTCDPLGRGTNKLSVYLKPSPSPPILGESIEERILFAVDSKSRFDVICTTPNTYSPHPDILWTHDGYEIDVRNKIYSITCYSDELSAYQTRQSVLTFNSFPAEVEGLYTCTWHNGLNPQVSQNFLLEPTGPLTITRKTSETISLNKGDPLDLSIEASGSYRDIVWFLNGKFFGVWFSNTTTFFMECPREKCTFSDFGKTLHIKSVANHHHGNFITRIVKSFTKCDQESSDGCTGESIYFKVNVFGAPEVQVIEENNGSEIILTCAVSGHPNPNIIWMLNNTILTSDTKYTISEEGDRLVVKNPLIGSYSCMATNTNPYSGDDTLYSDKDTYYYRVPPPSIAPSVDGLVTGVVPADTGVVAALGALVVALLIIVVFLIGFMIIIQRMSNGKMCPSIVRGKKTENPYQDTEVTNQNGENDYITMTPALNRTATSASALPLPPPPLSNTPTVSLSGTYASSRLQEANV